MMASGDSGACAHLGDLVGYGADARAVVEIVRTVAEIAFAVKAATTAVEKASSYFQ